MEDYTDKVEKLRKLAMLSTELSYEITQLLVQLEALNEKTLNEMEAMAKQAEDLNAQ